MLRGNSCEIDLKTEKKKRRKEKSNNLAVPILDEYPKVIKSVSQETPAVPCPL